MIFPRPFNKASRDAGKPGSLVDSPCLRQIADLFYFVVCLAICFVKLWLKPGMWNFIKIWKVECLRGWGGRLGISNNGLKQMTSRLFVSLKPFELVRRTFLVWFLKLCSTFRNHIGILFSLFQHTVFSLQIPAFHVFLFFCQPIFQGVLQHPIRILRSKDVSWTCANFTF